MSTTKFESTDLRVMRGDSETFTFNVTSAGVAFSLTGYTVTCQIKKNPDSETKLATITITDTAPSNFSIGKVVLSIPANTTALMDGQYHYDIQAVSVSAVLTLARGVITTFKDVTR